MRQYYERAMAAWIAKMEQAGASGIVLNGNRAYHTMKRDNKWTVEWIMAEAEKVDMRISKESAAIRNLVLYVSSLAMQYYAASVGSKE